MRGPSLVRVQLLPILLQIQFLAMCPQSQIASAAPVVINGNRNSSSKDVITVRAVHGDRAYLPCDIEVPLGSDDVGARQEGTISLILWYHGDLHSRSVTPIYTLDAIDQPVSKAGHFPNAEFIKRAHFNVLARPPVLKLEPVLESDAGEFRCRVDYNRRPSQNRFIRLDVIVPPSEVRIRDPDGNTLTGVIGPFEEGTPLVVTCEATDAKPRARVFWYENGKLIDDSDLPTPGHPRRLVSNELTIKRLDRSHLHTTFVCQARNKDEAERQESHKKNHFPPALPNTVRTANITIDMKLPPLEIRIDRIRQPLSTKKRAKATCTSFGGRPHPQLTWWINDKKLNVLGESVTFGDNFTTNTVSFLPKIDDNEKFLLCRAASYPLLSEPAFEDTLLLNVQYPPQLNLSLGRHMSNAGPVREGTDIYLDCQVQANPAVTEVFWKFEGRPLETDTHQGVIMANRSLALQTIRRESGGQYQCVAANSEGERESNEMKLRVYFVPVCRKRQNLVYGVAADEDAEIPCSVDADPPPTNFIWTFNDRNVDTFEENAFSFNGTRSLITYRPRFAKSYGILSCSATNEIGTQHNPCTYHVIPASPPSSVRMCIAKNQTVDTIQVKCKPGEAGGLRQTFHLEVFNFDLEYLEFNLTQLEAPTFQVTDLSPSTKYIFVLYATNAKGRSSPIRVVVSTPALPAERPLESTGLVATLVKVELVLLLGGVAVVVLLALSVIVILRRCRTVRDPQKGIHDNHSSTNLNDKNSGSCRSLKTPAIDEIQLTQMKSHHKNCGRSPPLMPQEQQQQQQQHEQQKLLGSKSASVVSMTLPNNSKARNRADDEESESMLVPSQSVGADLSVSQRKGLALRIATLRNSRHRLDEQLEKVDSSLDCGQQLFLSPRSRQDPGKSDSRRSSRNSSSHRSSQECGLMQDHSGPPISKQGFAPLVRLNSDEGGKSTTCVDAQLEETRAPLLKDCDR